MGLFDWVMHGLGFEDDGKTKKSKKGKALANDKYANFNLHEKVAGETGDAPSMSSMNAGMAGLNFPNESNIITFEPKSHKDIQQVVDCLKEGQTVAVNLGNISDADCERILDFLSGALYGLNGSIFRWSGDYFLLAPEGRKIYKKE